MLRNIHFVWKFIAGGLLFLAFLMIFHWEAYKQDYSAGEECEFLPEGRYYLEISYIDVSSKGDFVLKANSLVTAENVQGVELFSDWVPAGTGRALFTFDVPCDVRNVELHLYEGTVEWWRLQSISLMCYDNYFLSVLFVLLAAGTLVYGGHYYRKEHHAILGLVGMGLIASLPLFGTYMVCGVDLHFHFARINGIYEGIRTGQFPVRINPVQLEGYGYISGVMYPQLFLYFPALLKFLNLSSMFGMKLLILAANLSSALFTYFAVRRVSRSDRVAFIAAVMYTLNPYRISDFYSRGALGEGLALSFLPLVFWGTYEILWARKEKWWILALGMTGVLSSHILTVEFSAILIVLEIVLWLFSKRKSQVGKRLLAMGKAALFTIALNIYFLGPFLRFVQEEPRCFEIKNRPDLCTVDLIRAFEPVAHWSQAYIPWGTPGSMSVTLGSVTLAGIVLFVVFLLRHQGKDGLVELGKRCLISGGFFLVAALWIMPWENLMRVEWLESIVQAVQFPWRLLGIAALLFSIVSAIAVVEWEKVLDKSLPLWAFMLCGLLLQCGIYYSDMSYTADTVNTMEAEAENLGDDLYLVSNSLYLGFYDTRFSHIMCDAAAHLAWRSDREKGLDVECPEPKTVEWTNYTRNGLNISVDAFVKGSAGGSVEASFPLHFYPGYRVLIDGEKVEAYSYLSMVTCEIGQGSHHIEISYVGLPFFRVCDIITLCSIIGSGLWCGIGYYRRRRDRSYVEGLHAEEKVG